MISALHALAAMVTKKFGPEWSKNKEMTDVCPPQAMTTPTSVTSNTFDLLCDDEWETASADTATIIRPRTPSQIFTIVMAFGSSVCEQR